MPRSLSFTRNWREVSWCHRQVQTPSAVLLERWLFGRMDSGVSPASAVCCLLLFSEFEIHSFIQEVLIEGGSSVWHHATWVQIQASYLTLLGLSFFICKTAGMISALKWLLWGLNELICIIYAWHSTGPSQKLPPVYAASAIWRALGNTDGSLRQPCRALLAICKFTGQEGPQGGFPGAASGKDPPANAGRHKRYRFDPWVGNIPWRRAQQPVLVFLPRESHGQTSLVGYGPQGHKESTEVTYHAHTHTGTIRQVTPSHIMGQCTKAFQLYKKHLR